jgi:hypothetical protein
MGIDLADYDGDGRLDLFVTNHELETHTLFRNLGRGLFTDMTSQSGVGLETLPYVGFGTLFFDADNDGDLDLAIANGHVVDNSGHYRPGAKTEQRKLLFVNERGRLKEIGRQAGSGSRARRSAAGSMPPTSTTTAASICCSRTTATRRTCCGTPHRVRTTRSWCGSSGQAQGGATGAPSARGSC